MASTPWLIKRTENPNKRTVWNLSGEDAHDVCITTKSIYKPVTEIDKISAGKHTEIWRKFAYEQPDTRVTITWRHPPHSGDQKQYRYDTHLPK